MKSLSIFLLTIIWTFICRVYAGQSIDDWGPVTNHLQMSISLSGGEIKTNEPCILLIRYRNVSTYETFRIYEVNGTIYDPTYAFTVISPSGANISPDMAKINVGPSGQDHVLNPGQIVTIAFNMGSFCQFTEAGVYKIVAKKKRIWSTEKHQEFTVVSNPLEVTVTK